MRHWGLSVCRYAVGGRAQGYDFSLLDRNGGAGWDLATRLVCRRNALRRGRLSASEALRHCFFRPEF
jgi:hypothetical protein